MENLTVWHYTTREMYHEIFREGLLRPSSLFQGEGIRPILWFSFNQDWEESANRIMVCKDTGKKKLATKKEMAIYGRGLVRFGIHIKRNGVGLLEVLGKKYFPGREFLKKRVCPKVWSKKQTNLFDNVGAIHGHGLGN